MQVVTNLNRRSPIRGPIRDGTIVYIYLAFNDLILSINVSGGQNPILYDQPFFYKPDIILNNQIVQTGKYFRDYINYRLVVLSDGILSLSYAGNESTKFPNKNLRGVIGFQDLPFFSPEVVPLKFKPRQNVPTDKIYGGVSYDITFPRPGSTLQDVIFMPSYLDAYTLWNGNSMVNLSTIYTNNFDYLYGAIKLIDLKTSNYPNDNSLNTSKLVFPGGNCLTNTQGTLTQEDNGCLFVSETESYRKFWYNYCDLGKSCGDDGCFGYCQTRDCLYVPDTNAKQTYICEPPEDTVLPPINNKLPTYVVILLIVSLIIFVFIIICIFINIIDSIRKKIEQ